MHVWNVKTQSTNRNELCRYSRVGVMKMAETRGGRHSTKWTHGEARQPQYDILFPADTQTFSKRLKMFNVIV